MRKAIIHLAMRNKYITFFNTRAMFALLF